MAHYGTSQCSFDGKKALSLDIFMRSACFHSLSAQVDRRVMVVPLASALCLHTKALLPECRYHAGQIHTSDREISL